MGNYTVIADAGMSIISLLRREMIPEPIKKEEDIGLCSPEEMGNAILGLYLYDIAENPEVRNGEKIFLDREYFRNPPTSLNLYFMLFIKTKSGSSSRAVDEQRILGKAIQTLNDYSRLFTEELEGTLKEKSENLDIQGIVLSFDEKQKIYSLFEKKVMTAYFYKVGPVLIESGRLRRVKRVSKAVFDVQRKQR